MPLRYNQQNPKYGKLEGKEPDCFDNQWLSITKQMVQSLKEGLQYKRDDHILLFIQINMC